MIDSVYAADGGYIGNRAFAKILANRGIVPQRRSPEHDTCSIGFCEREQKWYGWSHRAMYGFGIGSTVEPGDCAYIADTPEGLIDDRYNFFLDISKESAQRHKDECQILPDRSGIRILRSPLFIPMVNSVEEAVASISGEEVGTTLADVSPGFSIQKCGRGAWTARTLDDAKQMAMDFAEDVS